MVNDRNNFTIVTILIFIITYLFFIESKFDLSDYRSYTTFQLNFDIGSGVKIHDNKIKGTWFSRHLTSGQ